MPEKEQEQIISKVLRKKANNVTFSAENIVIKNIHLELSNDKGKKIKVILNGNKNDKQTLFFKESLDNYFVENNMSSNKMRKLSTFVRSQTGWKSVLTNYHCHVSEKINSFEEVYKSSDTFEFETSTSKTKEKRPVVWANASELVEAVIELTL